MIRTSNAICAALLTLSGACGNSEPMPELENDSKFSFDRQPESSAVAACPWGLHGDYTVTISLPTCGGATAARMTCDGTAETCADLSQVQPICSQHVLISADQDTCVAVVATECWTPESGTYFTASELTYTASGAVGQFGVQFEDSGIRCEGTMSAVKVGQ